MVVERFFGAFLISAGVTFGLFWLMTTLIHVEGEVLPDKPLTVVEFVSVIPDSPVELIKYAPPIKKPAIEEPSRSELDPTKFLPSEVGIPIPSDPSPSNDPRNSRRPSLSTPDGDAASLVRVPPEYPDAAMRRGLEGRVLVSFSIGRDGSVFDARVIAAEPANVFDAAAIKAVRQWKYDPKVVDGEPVEQRDLRISIPFKRGGESG